VNGTSPQTGSPAERSNISSALPLPNTIAPGTIPLNAHSQRIDPYMRPPTGEEWSIYNKRFQKQKPCNSFHLQRVCTMFGCPYDHQELEPESRHVLEYVLKCSPCPEKGNCRAGDCYYGHVCQKDGCQGQLKGCRMKMDLHGVDPNMVSQVPAEEEELVHGQMGPEDVGVGAGAGAGVQLQMPDENGYMW
jgi:hypothetical protein